MSRILEPAGAARKGEVAHPDRKPPLRANHRGGRISPGLGTAARCSGNHRTAFEGGQALHSNRLVRRRQSVNSGPIAGRRRLAMFPILTKARSIRSSIRVCEVWMDEPASCRGDLWRRPTPNTFSATSQRVTSLSRLNSGTWPSAFRDLFKFQIRESFRRGRNGCPSCCIRQGRALLRPRRSHVRAGDPSLAAHGYRSSDADAGSRVLDLNDGLPSAHATKQ